MTTSFRLRLPKVVDVPAEAARAPLRSRVAWMFVIWIASVSSLAIVAALIKLALAR